MSLHADECTVPRRCSREQPRGRLRGQEPATISQLRRSSPQACWRYQRDKTGVFPVIILEGGFSPVIPARPRLVTPRSGLPFKNHGGPPSAVTTGGACLDPLPRGRRRHLFFRSGSSAGVASGAESRSARRWERPTTRGLLVRFQSPVQQCDGSRSNARPRHTHCHPSSDSAERHPGIVVSVAHRRRSMFAAHRVDAARALGAVGGAVAESEGE